MSDDQPGRRAIPIRDLPQNLVADVHQKIRLHSIAMVLSVAETADPFACSGTLVEINGIVGVLTARHVWTDLVKVARTVGLLVGGHEPYWIKPDVLRAFGPRADGVLPGTSVQIPDLAFVRIPPVARGTIEAAKKLFYSLEVRRRDPQLDLFSERGFWVLTGSPQALFDSTTRTVGSILYDTTVERRIEQGDWDYIITNLDLPQNPALPETYRGLSGGGIWRAAFYVTEHGTEFLVERASRDILLSGVAFYQTDLPGRQIIGHGPRSLYRTLYDHIGNEIT